MRILAVTPMFFAFLAPLFAAAAPIIGQALVGAAVSFGLGYLARKLQPQPADAGQRGMSLSLQMETNEPRQWVFGRCASAGSLKYHNTYGPNGNDYLQLVFVLADHECDALESVIVNGEAKTIGGDASTAFATGNGVADYAGVMWVKFYPGTWTQTADADLVARAKPGGWTAQDRGRGVCYVRVTLKADPEIYKSGLPEFVFVFRAAKLYDPRKDATLGGTGSHAWSNEATREWSDNAALIAYNYLRGVNVNGELLAGINAPAASLPYGDWTAVANACDEAVARKTGGPEPRYRASGMIEVSTEPRAVLREVLAACAGDLIDSGGIFKLRPATAQASVITITDADLMLDGDAEFSPKRSRSELINTVYGSFTDPAQNYEMTALPPRVSSADRTADGGIELAEHYALPFVTSPTQGQRVLEILRRKGRLQQRLSLPMRARFAVLEAGDWVTVNSSRFGISGGLFEVLQCQLGRDLSAAVELAETTAGLDAWTAATDELDIGAPREVESGGSTFTTVAGWNLANVTVAGGAPEVTRPGLRATWTPVDDPTVTAIEIEFRRVGDTVALRKTAVQPTAGEYTWVDGVQGATIYEARALPVTNPPRTTSWTAWDATGSSSGGQAVAVAVTVTEVESVPPDTITPEMLSPQARLELALVTAREEIQGSVSARLREIRQDLEIAAQSTIGVVADQSRRLDRVSRSLEGTTLSVTELQEVTEDMQARWAVAIDVNGRVVGRVQLSGDNQTSAFDVLAGSFTVSSPDGTITPFIVVPGEGTFIEGAVLKDGSISADKMAVLQLSAITADIGIVTTGRLQNAANTSYLDLNTGDFQLG